MSLLIAGGLVSKPFTGPFHPKAFSDSMMPLLDTDPINSTAIAQQMGPEQLSTKPKQSCGRTQGISGILLFLCKTWNPGMSRRQWMRNADCEGQHRAPSWGRFWMDHSEPKVPAHFFHLLSGINYSQLIQQSQSSPWNLQSSLGSAEVQVTDGILPSLIVS